jgi:hypothetical protein
MLRVDLAITLYCCLLTHGKSSHDEHCIWQLGEVNYHQFVCILSKSVAGCLLPCLPFFLSSRCWVAYFFLTIATQCELTQLVWLKFAKGCQSSNVTKNVSTAISQSRGLSLSCFEWFIPQIVGPCFFLKNPATHNFFHLLNTP